MNKTPSNQNNNSEDELLVEYCFDYQNAKSNRFATRSQVQKLTVVVLDEDVAQFFKTPEAVDQALRGLIGSVHN